MLSAKNRSLGEMPFLDHIRELRKRIIISLYALLIAVALSFVFYNIVISILFGPLKTIQQLIGEEEFLFVHTIFEGFILRMKISIIAGIILSLPVHLYNILKYVFPGLKENEKTVIFSSLSASFVLGVFAFFYSYFKIIPMSVSFLTSYGFIPANVGLLLNYGKSIFYIFQFLLISLLLFQLPIVFIVLMTMNILKRKTLLRLSRYIMVVIFILSAIMTPPDFISQVSLALPLIVLFFLTIGIAKALRIGES